MMNDVSPGSKRGTSIDMPPVARIPHSPKGEPATRVLGDRYLLTGRLAVGGMGEVWAATDNVLGRSVAIKILRDDLVDSPGFLERFRAEARHTAALSHPGVAGVYDYGEDHDGDRRVAYLVMELVPGQPLSRVMADRGPLSVNTVLSLLAQTAEALHAAHVMGVVHRDVKPGNLLLLEDGRIKVTDFGIARAANSVSLTEVGQVIGTARYISPEQAAGGIATPASDVYSLGVIGYEMLAGHPPFAGDNAGALAMAHTYQVPEPLPATVPAGVRAAIESALSKDPSDRPRDAHAFASELRRLQLSTMPPPALTTVEAMDPGEPTLVAELSPVEAPTRVMGSKTEIMPTRAVVAGTRDLGLSQEPYAARRQRRRIAAAALVTIVVAFALLQLRPTGGARSLQGLKASSTTVAFVTVDPKAIVGLTAAKASDVLSKEGLLVATTSAAAGGIPAGVVTAVDPSGQVAVGTRVTLTVSSGPAPSSTAAVVTTTTGKSTGRVKGHKPKD